LIVKELINMFDKIPISEFKKYLAIEKERQLALQEVSEILGVDISFSEKEVIKNAEEAFAKEVNKRINKGVNAWMKSRFS
tara:strand:- start:121 stop:360 length:240 start_codon:yes stop_codon:yes gene_type:complete